MIFCPVKQSKLKLCHLYVQILIVAALAHFLCHVCAYLRDTGVILMLPERNKKVKL